MIRRKLFLAVLVCGAAGTLHMSGECAFRFGLGKAVGKSAGDMITKAVSESSVLSKECGSGPYFTAAPVDLSKVSAIAPLGNLNPTGHVFPSDHIYFYFKTQNESYPLFSPGDLVLTEINTSAQSSGTDYSLRFQACKDFKAYYLHVKTISDTLTSAMQSQAPRCTTYTTGGSLYTYCTYTLNLRIKAGEQIGTVSGPGAFDFGATDYRIAPLPFANPSRHLSDQLYTACPLDYYSADVKGSLYAKVGRYDGGQTRTTAPVCGEIMQDVGGTAQGDWYLPGSPDSPEDPHLALVKYSIDPSWSAFSVGNSVSGLTGVHYFSPKSSGKVLTAFSQVTADGNTYCYDCFMDIGNITSPCTTRGYIILLQLPSPATLKIEKQTAQECFAGPWTFSNPVTFQR